MRKDEDVLKEIIPLIKQDSKNLLYFFSKAKEPKWFEPMRLNDLFNPSSIPEPIRTERGLSTSFWPQQHYLEHLSKLILDKEITDPRLIKNFIDVLRSITNTKGNFLLGRVLFLSLIRVPLKDLTTDDILNAFKWLVEENSESTIIANAVHEGLALVISRVTKDDHERKIFKTYFGQVLTRSKKENKYSKDPELLFFSQFGLIEFKKRYFDTQKISDHKPYLLLDGLEIVEAELTTILNNSDLDDSTEYWRPAVEDHHQNNYHDSAQSILVGFIYAIGLALRAKQMAIPNMSIWKESKFLTFKRIYFAFSALETETTLLEEAAKKIIEVGLISNCKHEIYHLLHERFGQFESASQNKIVDLIESISVDYDESSELNQRYAAWQKLGWVEAISVSKIERVAELRKELLVLTENQLPDHPDFGSYMGPSWVGPTSPKTIEELAKCTPDEILNLLINFENSKAFGTPSVDGLARVLQDYIATDPFKGSWLISKMDRLDYQYVSALIDGYSKSWSEKKYVPIQDIISKTLELLNADSFQENLKNSKSTAHWAVSSICSFIETGTRDDDNSYPLSADADLYSILKKCLESCPPDNRFESSSDVYTRAINEPRGRIFGALVILTLRRARTSEKDSEVFRNAWNDLRDLIEPILKCQSIGEVSLHALLGAYYRQFFFLNKDWFVRNIDLIAPAPEKSVILWRAFMDGFSYVTDYSKEMYELLKNEGHLLAYLRFQVDPSDKNSRLDRLQNRVIELALIAYVLGHEKISEGIVGSIIDGKMADEWHQIIRSIKTIIGLKPAPEHLTKAKELIAKLISTKESGGLGETWKEHFRGLGLFLDQMEDPSDPMVPKIFQIVSCDKDSPWELGDLIDYLHQFRESHPKIIGELFRDLLSASTVAPSYPPDQVRDICQALVKHSETASMVGICRFYSERSVTCEPIRDICAGLK